MLVQFGEYTKNPWAAHFRRENMAGVNHISIGKESDSMSFPSLCSEKALVSDFYQILFLYCSLRMESSLHVVSCLLRDSSGNNHNQSQRGSEAFSPTTAPQKNPVNNCENELQADPSPLQSQSMTMAPWLQLVKHAQPCPWVLQSQEWRWQMHSVQ